MSTTSPHRNPAPRDREHAAPLDDAVHARYSDGAARTVPGLCCPTDYDPELLAVIPEEVIRRDYGCGNPSRHLRPGETVLDLGSGTGKICVIAAQVVGATGRVIGVDMNDDMLAVARRAAPVVAERLGYANTSFHKARIEDLALDREALERHLAGHPVASEAELTALERHMAGQRARHPLIPDGSVDAVVSNCVLNLVLPESRQRLFEELFRVLRRGGRAIISDIVCDEALPGHLARDPALWSGCIAGAFREDAFLHAFEQAGFHGIEILERAGQPWQVVEGIEFRSLTVQAFKGKQGACLEQHHAVVYRGPWRRVEDDDGHVLERGQRMAVCGKTHALLTAGPYAAQVIGIAPRVAVPESAAAPFACTGTRVRNPRETKGADYSADVPPSAECCEPGTCC
jgi:SAM-dependent methyltransferase